METNYTIKPESGLHDAGHKLLEAAHEYWEIYNRECGNSAVVWLENDNGHFVLFTRSEYKDSIMSAANREKKDQIGLFDPFIKEE